jgi:hypothetical protein
MVAHLASGLWQPIFSLRLPDVACCPQVAYYCCKEHQVRHWKQHKQVCKHLQQLAKATAAGGN